MSAFVESPGHSGRESFRFGYSIIAAVVCGVVAIATHAAEPKLLKVPTADDWRIEIVPGPAIGTSPVPKFDRAVRQALDDKPQMPPAPNAEPNQIVVPAGAEVVMPTGINMASYIEVYNSIPFRRSEFLANPSFRHDATIELMLGQIRPKTITNVTVTQSTCCWPQAATYAPYGNPYDFRFSRYRP